MLFRSPEHVLDEIGVLIEKYHIKEIMDDTGTFPVGEWLKEFCEGMIARGYNKKIRFNCNMRFGALKQRDYDLIAKAGFRFILYGLESAKQETLDRIHKSLRVSAITEGAKMAKKAGLHPHLTTMIGYPWETREDALRTIQLAKELFRKGYVNTLQATIVIPYPGTPLFNKAVEGGFVPPASVEGWADTEGWGELLSPHVPGPTRYFMNASKKYFRGAFLYPKLKPFYNARMALFRKWPRASSLEWRALRAAEFTVRKILTRLNLKRWANR